MIRNKAQHIAFPSEQWEKTRSHVLPYTTIYYSSERWKIHIERVTIYRNELRYFLCSLNGEKRSEERGGGRVAEGGNRKILEYILNAIQLVNDIFCHCTSCPSL